MRFYLIKNPGSINTNYKEILLTSTLYNFDVFLMSTLLIFIYFGKKKTISLNVV